MPYTNGSSKNILVGAAAFFIGVDSAAVPALGAASADAKDTFANAANWRNVGFTTDGVEVAYQPDYGDVVVDQLLDSARIFKQGMKVMVNTSFSEATVENMLVVWGQDSSTLTGTPGTLQTLSIEGGALGGAATERQLAFVGPGPRAVNNTQRVYTINRAIQTESTSHALKRSDPTALPVSFRCLPGTYSSGGTSYGVVVDRAYTGTT